MPLPMFQEKTKIKQPKLLAIAAGKGGVGKSTVTVHLAESLSRQGLSVGVLDCDLYGPSLRHMLPDQVPPEQRGAVFVPGVCRMGIKMLSMAYFRSDSEAAVMRGPIANSIILQFLKEVDWGDLDYLLLDFPPGTGDIQLTLAQQASLFGAIMVTTPQEVALLDVRKAKEMFTRLGVPIIGVVENMSYCLINGQKSYLFGQEGGRRLSIEWHVPLLGEIPIIEEISRCGDAGESLFKSDQSDAQDAARIFVEIAKKIRHPEPSQIRSSLEIRKLYKKSTGLFVIEWSDGSVMDYCASTLQKQCPCARCRENPTVQSNDESEAVIDIDRIEPVGRYALKIRFNQGCSLGIYPFEMLRSK